jgi:hypothetical protein
MSNIIRFLATIAIMFWYCAAFGQSNCSYITYLLTSDTKTIPDISASGCQCGVDECGR